MDEEKIKLPYVLDDSWFRIQLRGKSAMAMDYPSLDLKKKIKLMFAESGLNFLIEIFTTSLNLNQFK